MFLYLEAILFLLIQIYLQSARDLFVTPKENSINRKVNEITGIIQPTLCFDGEQYYAFMRSFSISNELKRVFVSKSADGINWGTPQITDIPNPNSSLDCVFYKNHFYLAMNPSTSERWPISLIKLDKDLNYIQMLDIEKDVIMPCFSKQLSYPSIIEHEGKLHVTFTNGRKRIQYNVINLE